MGICVFGGGGGELQTEKTFCERDVDIFWNNTLLPKHPLEMILIVE